jgi:hypothetical protein
MVSNLYNYVLLLSKLNKPLDVILVWIIQAMVPFAITLFVKQIQSYKEQQKAK